MTFQDEQESQIEPAQYSFEDEISSWSDEPCLAQQINVIDEQEANAHIGVACGDDIVPDHEMLSSAEEHIQHESCCSLVPDTQFVGVELDTQATDCFDRQFATYSPTDRPEYGPELIFSPNTRPKICANQPSPPFKRPAAEVHSPIFQFGPGPNPGNMKFTRRHPGTIKSLDHGSMSKDATAVGLAQTSQPIDGASFPISARQSLRIPNVKNNAENKTLHENELTHAARQLNTFVPKGNVTYKQKKQNYKIGGVLSSEVKPTKSSFGTLSVNKLPFDDVAPKPTDISHAKDLSEEIQSNNISESSRQFPPLETVSTGSLSHHAAKIGFDTNKTAGGAKNARKIAEHIQPTSENMRHSVHKSSNRIILISEGNSLPARTENSVCTKASSIVSALKLHLDDEHLETSLPRSCIENVVSWSNSESTVHDVQENETAKTTCVNEDTSRPQNLQYGSEANLDVRKCSLNVEGCHTNQATVQFPVNRPLADTQLQPASLEHNESLHSIYCSKAIKKAHSRSRNKNGTSSVDRAHTEVSGSITAMEMLQMAVIQASAEKATQNAVLGKTRQQEAKIADLQEKNMTLSADIAILSSEIVKEKGKIDVLNSEKRESIETIKHFQARCVKYKDHMNDVIRAQKQLHSDAEVLRGEILKMAHEKALELDDSYRAAQLEQYPVSRLKNFKGVLKEARKALADERQTNEVLRRELSNLCMELQREQAMRKSLKENNGNHEELKSFFSNHFFAITSNATSYENSFQILLSTVAGNETKLDACLASIQDIKEREPKPSPELKELQQLVKALPAIVENQLHKTNECGLDIHRNIAEIFSHVKTISTLINDNKSINVLQKENATANERILVRDAELALLKDRLDHLKLDLETCRNQMGATTELNKALNIPRDDTILRSQLLDIQNFNSNLKEHAEIYRRETEKVTSDLRAQEESSLVVRQQIVEAKKSLQEAEAKISGFEMEKEVYVQRSREESDILRIEMERNAQLRLKDETAQYMGTISGLRRQLCESKAETLQKQNELDKRDQMAHDAETVAAELRVEIENLETRIGHQSMELDLIKENLRTKDDHQNSAVKDVQGLRGQLSECQKNTKEWRGRVEGSILQVTQHCETTREDIMNAEKGARAEIAKLKDQLAELLQKNKEHETMKDDLVRYLRRRGLLLPDITLGEWTTMIFHEQPREKSSFLGFGHGASQDSLISAMSERLTALPQPKSIAKDDTTDIDIREKAASAELVTDLTSDLDGQSKALPDMVDKDNLSLREKLLPIGDTDTTTAEEKDLSQNETGMVSLANRETLKNEPNMSAKILQSPHVASAPGRLPFPSTEAISRSLLKKSGSGDVISNSHKHARRLDNIDTFIIPDSQEVLFQEQSQSPIFTQPTRRIAQRRDSIAVIPQPQETGRTITRTEVTEYSIRTSKTYENTPEFSQSISNEKPAKRPQLPNEENDIAEILSECSSSTSLSDVDLDKYLEHFEERPQPSVGQRSLGHKATTRNSLRSHEKGSPYSTAGGVHIVAKSKEGVQHQGIKLPKSILKRTHSFSQTSETEVGKDRNQPLKISWPSRAENKHTRSGANRRQSGQSNGIDALIVAPYNRIVSGLKVPPRSAKGRILGDVKQQTLASQTINGGGTGSSPIVEQPQRNLKKRSLSKVAINDTQRSTKLQRVDKD